MYQYLVYGIIIHSDIALYNLVQTEGPADAYVRCLENFNKDVLADSDPFYFSEKYVRFRTPNGTFSIRDGKEIIIEPGVDADPFALAAFVLGWCFAFLFTQRGFSALHCTALDINGKGVLVSGVSGSGKSTTALSLIRRGYKYLADDIVMLRPLDSPNIVPAYPLQKVCGDVAEQLPPEQLLYINEQRDKYAYLNRKDYCHQPRKLSSIFIIRADDEDTVRVEEITGLNKYLRTLECLFLAEVYADVGTPDGDKFQCLKIAEQVRFYMIKRPKNIDTVEQVADCIESLVAG